MKNTPQPGSSDPVKNQTGIRNENQNQEPDCLHTQATPIQPIAHGCEGSAPVPNPNSKFENRKSVRPASSNITAAQGSVDGQAAASQYRLAKGLGVWQLTFAGREALLK